MKKHGILNSEISNVLSNLGHTDTIMIADCGLPIPDGVLKIDLALKPGEPKFINVLEVVMRDLVVEKFTFAEEIVTENANVNAHMHSLLNDVESEILSHEELKQLSKECKAIVRTGEITPYANVILQAGVDFKELYENYCQEH